MMPYVIGQDPETGEILVGDTRQHEMFLRGPASAETQIRDLVQAANQWCHTQMQFEPGGLRPPRIVDDPTV